jgi:integrase
MNETADPKWFFEIKRRVDNSTSTLFMEMEELNLPKPYHMGPQNYILHEQSIEKQGNKSPPMEKSDMSIEVAERKYVKYPTPVLDENGKPTGREYGWTTKGIYIPKRETKHFSKGELRRIMDAVVMEPHKYIAFLLGICTGCRVGEVIKMTPQDLMELDGLNGIYVFDSKKKRHRGPVPLPNDKAAHIIEYIEKNNIQPDDQIVKLRQSKRGETLNRWLKSACKKAGIQIQPWENVRWHSFRASFIVNHHRDGKSDKWLMKMTGDDYKTLLGYYTNMNDGEIFDDFHNGNTEYF